MDLRIVETFRVCKYFTVQTDVEKCVYCNIQQYLKN